MDPTAQASRIWLRQQSRQGRRGARPVLALGLAATVAAIAQVYDASPDLRGRAPISG